MKTFFTSFWFWGILLVTFIVIILWDDKIQETVINSYIKHRMILTDVNFSQVEKGFEEAKMHAEIVDMDENQNNMNAVNVRTLFYKRDNASFTGTLLAEKALKNPFEVKFWGNVRGWTTDGDKIKTEEMRYYFNRKELFTQLPVTLWKDNAVITGIGMRYNTQTKEAQINQQVMIRIWDKNASATLDATSTLPVPEAPPLDQILKTPINNRTASDSPALAASETVPITKQENPDEKK